MAIVTRTTNPLPFADLEPHRFEDLVRQIAYDFRQWRSIEATGRLGGDDGIDIRAMEAVSPIDSAEADDESISETATDRLWIIQCKREKRLGPTDLRNVVKESVRSLEHDPYGLIIAAACDFSKKARDAALKDARMAGVQELQFWGKAELEDLLFQPKNDHLLFAYFGISLQVRRRSVKTNLRSRLETKRKAIRVLGEISEGSREVVFIRNAGDTNYPQIANREAFLQNPQWGFVLFRGHDYPDHLVFELNRYYALGDPQTETWDIFEPYDLAEVHNEIAFLKKDFGGDGYSGDAYAFWASKPEAERGYFTRWGLIHYDNILAIDEAGDKFHDGPHIYVEFKNSKEPFDWFNYRVKLGVSPHSVSWTPEDSKRRKLFPGTFPNRH